MFCLSSYFYQKSLEAEAKLHMGQFEVLLSQRHMSAKYCLVHSCENALGCLRHLKLIAIMLEKSKLPFSFSKKTFFNVYLQLFPEGLLEKRTKVHMAILKGHLGIWHLMNFNKSNYGNK